MSLPLVSFCIRASGSDAHRYTDTRQYTSCVSLSPCIRRYTDTRQTYLCASERLDRMHKDAQRCTKMHKDAQRCTKMHRYTTVYVLCLCVSVHPKVHRYKTDVSVCIQAFVYLCHTQIQDSIPTRKVRHVPPEWLLYATSEDTVFVSESSMCDFYLYSIYVFEGLL